MTSSWRQGLQDGSNQAAFIEHYYGKGSQELKVGHPIRDTPLAVVFARAQVVRRKMGTRKRPTLSPKIRLEPEKRFIGCFQGGRRPQAAKYPFSDPAMHVQRDAVAHKCALVGL